MLLSLGATEECELPQLSIGDVNVTSEAQWKSLLKTEEFFIFSVTASWCSHCCRLEPILREVLGVFERLSPRVSLIRADLAKNPYLKRNLKDSDQMPQIYAVTKGKFYKFHEEYNPYKIIGFIDKVYKPIHKLIDEEEINEFLEPPEGNNNFLTVLAFLYDDEDDEDSVLKQYERAALELAGWSNIKMGLVTEKPLIKELKRTEKYILYLNSLLLLKRDSSMKQLDLAVPQEIHKWIVQNGVGLVEELTPYNFQVYDGIKLPILIMFIDPNNINQQEYLKLFTKVARDYDDSVKFV